MGNEHIREDVEVKKLKKKACHCYLYQGRMCNYIKKCKTLCKQENALIRYLAETEVNFGSGYKGGNSLSKIFY